MRAENLPLLTLVSAPAVHPDGSHAVVSATRPDFDADAYVGQLWRVPLAGGAPLRITRGFRDTNPKFSPDGRLLGFLRAAQGEPAQLAVVPAGGGEPMVVTDAKLGGRDFAFSPDGTRLAFTAKVPEPGHLNRRAPKLSERARHESARGSHSFVRQSCRPDRRTRGSRRP